MIALVRGTIRGVDGLAVLVEPAGGAVVYEVLVPAYLARRLAAKTGQEIELTTLQYLEGQGQGASYIPRLVGFASPLERKFFDLFTTVKGIGNRKALRAMEEEPGNIAAAITRRDAKWLQELPEIGRRLAETIIAELTGKVDLFAVSQGGDNRVVEPKVGARAAAGGEHEAEAVEALVRLGEVRPEAQRRVDKAVARLRAAASMGEKSPTTGEILASVYEGG